MYFSAQEMLAQLEGTDERICDLVIKMRSSCSKPPAMKS